MNLFIKVLVVGTVFIPFVSSLICPKCNSATSWSHCTENQVNHDCGSLVNKTCASVKMIRNLEKVYQKECTLIDRCTKEAYCGSDTQNCEISCCQTDHCTSNAIQNGFNMLLVTMATVFSAWKLFQF
ncbi:uncharacterized protein [Clytia hemisphaerica]|uniref:uncharacterized protein n=1 Tax=Clytia hemisphaerica TaxID=252671 RepID=UPI0034D77C82|eukprot:TCONS_00066124-protein